MVQYHPHTARAGRFSQRAQWGLHLGIERNYNAWKIFDIHSKETIAARDVIFYERLTLPTYLLYVDNKAMLALCREQRLEHRTKHIALRYFLARELQQRGQLRLAYVASEANTADVFTKALAPCDHQRCCTQLGLVPVLPHLLTS
ncbi:unnamed protein product [Closterium sp. NIES-53]